MPKQPVEKQVTPLGFFLHDLYEVVCHERLSIEEFVDLILTQAPNVYFKSACIYCGEYRYLVGNSF